MEVLQVDKFNCICCFTQKGTYGVQERSLTRTSVENHTINCLTFEENTRQPYNDNLLPFRPLALHMHENQRLGEETLKSFKLFISRTDGLSPDQFQGFHLNDIPTVEDLLVLKFLLYDVDILDGNIVGDLARQNVQKYENTVRLLRYNTHICYVNNNNSVFQSFRCPNCGTFFNKTFKLEQHLTMQ